MIPVVAKAQRVGAGDVAEPNVMPSQRTIYRLEELNADPELVGSKASSLARLMSMGIAIPPTAVVPIPVYRRMAEVGLLDPSKMSARIASLRIDEIRSETLEHLRREFSASRFAVRSSANAEDLCDKSFAGQYESVIDVPLERVPDAIRNVWGSLWSQEAMSYRAGLDRIPGMAVIIQPFIEGGIAGVAFSANPVTGNPFEIVFEYSSGECSGVTDGTAQTERFVVDVRALLNGKRVPEPFATVAAVCVRFERPVDIEWAVDSSGRVLILQERPLVLEQRHGLGNAELLKYQLALPEPLSRLGASLEFEKNRIYARAVRHLGSPMYTSRMITVYSRQFLREQNEEPTFSARDAIATGARAATHLPTYLLLRRRLMRSRGLERQGCANPIEAFLGLVNEYLRLYQNSIYVGQLYTLFTGLLVRYAQWLTGGKLARPLLYNLFKCPSSVAALRDDRLSALAQQLQPAGDSDWLAMQTEQFRQSYAAYCRDFGYVFNDGNPRDPFSRIDSKLAYHLLRSVQGARPAEVDITFLESVEREIGATRLGPIHLRLFRTARRLYQPLALVKEDRNHLFYLASGRLRDFITKEFTSLARELSLRSIDEMYFLSLREIARRDVSERRLRLRQRLYVLSRAFVDPYPRRARAAVPAGASYLVLEGIPCVPGVSTGQVVFVETRDDFAKIKPGSILVTHTVRPFWTPILRSCHGLLASSGNILSHGASIAREYGVPAVFGLGEQITRLREGQVVTVDGSMGKAIIEQPAPDAQVLGRRSDQ